MSIKKILLLLGAVLVVLYVMRDVYPFTLLTHPVLALITPFTDQAYQIGSDLYTSVTDNSLGLGPILAIAAPVSGILVKSVYGKIQSLKSTAGNEILSLKTTVNQLFTEKGKVEQQVAQMTGTVAELGREKEGLTRDLLDLKTELFDLQTHKSQTDEYIKQLRAENLTYQRALEALKPTEAKTYIE